MGNSVMTAEQFVYWLQGYFEISGNSSLTEDQIKMVKQHLTYVFTESPIFLLGGGADGSKIGRSGYVGFSGYSGYDGLSGFC